MSKSKPSSRASKRWPEHLVARLKTLRAQMSAHNIDGLLISHPVDIQYLTGFSGEDSWALVWSRGITILSDSRFEEELKNDCPYAKLVIRKVPLQQVLGKEVSLRSIKTLGIQAEHITLQQRKDIVKHVGAKKLKSIGSWLVNQRAVKDQTEIKLIKKAVKIQEDAFTQTMSEIKPGMTEKQIAAKLEYHMRYLGADGAAFTMIVGAEPNGSKPHYLPGNFKVKKGRSLLIDWGAYYGGYRSDMTRTVALGKFPPRIAEIYEIVRASHQAGIDAVKPGAKLADVDAAARQVIQDAGYGKEFSHSLGHGIGLEIHEEPRLSSKAKGTLQPGHIVTIEPGIYLPGIGGVRLEDDVLVTKTGGKNLCSLPTDIKSVII